MAFEKLTPLQACARFSRGVGRPVRYQHGPTQISVSTPSGYREHLEILEEILGDERAPYFGPHLEYPREGRSIWEGYRGIEEYAREVFPIEEYANGLRWMDEGRETPSVSTPNETNTDDGESNSRSPPMTPVGYITPVHTSNDPRSHPEGNEDDFFVGSC